jgi:hypothetical protein
MKINKNKLKGRPFICYKIPNKKNTIYFKNIPTSFLSQKPFSPWSPFLLQQKLWKKKQTLVKQETITDENFVQAHNL